MCRIEPDETDQDERIPALTKGAGTKNSGQGEKRSPHLSIWEGLVRPMSKRSGSRPLARHHSGGATYMQKITPFLWFDGKAEEAMHFYTSIFKNSKIGKVT